MLRNYIVIAIRNLLRQRTYSFINIGGLALGIACTILLGIYVYSELSYDSFHENANRIVVAHMEGDMGDGSIQSVSLTPTALLPTMLEKFPEVARGTRLYYPGIFKPPVVAYEGTAFQEKGFCYADSVFFSMFSFPLVNGDPTTVLNSPENIVLSETAKNKYFGDSDAIGKSIQVNAKTFIVAGIMEDVPSNSSIQLDFVAPFSSYWKRDPIWGSANYITYIELNKQVAPEVLSSLIQSELRSMGLSDPDNSRYFGFQFTPFLDMHLFSDVHVGGDIGSLYIFGTVALLILFIALINYTNLATARSFYRAKEIGLRKTLGAFRRNVILQLLGESFITTFVAMLLALVLAYFLFPVFNSLSGASIQVNYLNKPSLIIALVLLYIVIALLAGIYPALKMASFNPATILKGKYQSSGQGAWLRKALIVLQFVISITLIVSTTIIYNQLEYINKKDLGYSRDNTVVIPVSKKIRDKSVEFITVLKQNSGIIDVTISSETPINIQGGYSLNQNGGRSFGVVAAAIDENYLATLDISLIAGRGIERADIIRCRETEEYSFLINETTATLLEWSPAEAVGQEVELNGRIGKIVGVVQDFHFRAFYEPVQQLVLFTEHDWAYNYAMIKISSSNIPESISTLESSWISFDEATPFSYTFLDTEFEQLYLNTNRTANLLTTFALLAILIASLGLFGIVSFSMVQRSKEIGIRKVLGASVKSILLMTNREFLVLIIISFLVAFPLAYYFMNLWLSGFVYHISIGILPILLGAGFSFIVAISTISFETLKAALLNPVETLRNE